MCKVYGYCRVSTKTQKLQRQIDNIKQYDASAIIFDEKYTGTKLDGREEFGKLLKKVKAGDTIVFDSVSRMSRNADEGVKTYFELFEKGVNLIFLKEHYIDTDVYAENMKDKIELQGTDEDEIFKGLNNYFRKLAERQIRIAFEQAEKEVADLQQRVREGIAKSDKKQGIEQGTKLITNKSITMKEKMKRQLKDFGGTETDKQFMSDNAIARNTFYKYKKELAEELNQ